ncbi:MAG: hypothetical protein GX589_03630 [Deltaproteobacteria bacterium]|nr:hypothetical protein [Deltaproteobacteria bacterium]
MNNPIQRGKKAWEGALELAKNCLSGIDRAAARVQEELLGKQELPELALPGGGEFDLNSELVRPILASSPEGESRDSTTTDLNAQQTLLEERFGIDRGALKALDRETLGILARLIQKGPCAARLSIRILNAVHRTSPSREREALRKLDSYPGRLDILEDFLNQIGHDDPFIATARAQVIVLPIRDIPHGAKVSEDPVGHRERVRGTSGHIITGMIYCAYDPDSPPTSVGFFSKRQAVMRPFESFNPERFSTKKSTEVQQRRSQLAQEILENLTLLDLEQQPELVEELGSPLIARNLAVYRELQAAIAAYKEQADAIMYGGQITISTIERFRVRTDLGGSFLSWFQRQIEADVDLPEGIRIAYENFVDPNVDLSPAEERDIVRGLLAYQRLHSFISKETVFSGIEADLKEYDALSQNDPLRLDARVEAARRMLQESAAGGESEMRVSELGAVLSLSGMTEFRRAMNARELALYGGTFERAIQHFKGLMIKDGRWREDCLQESVPMKRLKLTLYGAKIGVENESDLDKRAVLTQQDFKAIYDAIFHFTISSGDDRRFLCAMPIPHFREMVARVVVAYRKAAYLDAALAEYQAANTSQGEPPPLNREDIGDALADWKPVLIFGNNLKPEEVFMREERLAGNKVWRLADLATCANCRGLGNEHFRKLLPQIEREAGAGLFLDAHEPLLKEVYPRAELFLPASELTEVIEQASEVLSLPLVRPVELNMKNFLRLPFLSALEVEEVKLFAKFKDKVEGLGLNHSAEQEALKQRLKAVRCCNVLRGQIGTIDEAHAPHLILREEPFAKFAGEITEGSAAYFNPSILAERLDQLDRDFISKDQLPGGWSEKLKLLCSKEAMEALRSQGLGLVDRDTWVIAQYFQHSYMYYIERKLVDTVQTMRTEVDPQTTMPAKGFPHWIGPTYHFYWKTVEAETYPHIGFGSLYKNLRISDLLNPDDPERRKQFIDYLNWMRSKESFPAHTKAIATEIIRLAKTPGPFPEQKLTDWLRAHDQEWKQES